MIGLRMVFVSDETACELMMLVQCNAVPECGSDVFQQILHNFLRHIGLAHVQAREAALEELVNDPSFPGQHFGMCDDDQFHYK